MKARAVCILTSGKGTRMGPFASLINKALLPIKQKALLSQIIEHFPADTEFIITIGHLGDQVKTYLELAHPDRRIRLVPVDRYEGPGTGPGYSLLACEPFLQRPFYFIACDAMWNQPFDLDLEENWLGTSAVPAEDSIHYCNLQVEGDRIVGLRDKERVTEPGFKAFVGICHIRDYAPFWKALRDQTTVAGEHQISNGLRALIQLGTTRDVPIDWSDVGDLAKYRTVLSRHENYDFSKSDEFLYIVNRRVIKFFADARVTERRVARARMNPGVFPKIVASKDGFYSYEFQAGTTLYENNSPAIFSRLLDWLSHDLWRPVSVEPTVFRDACNEFYRVKTLERVQKYWKKYNVVDAPSLINGKKIPTLQSLLDQVPWTRVLEGKPVFFHGDLQFDNILFDQASGKFVLLDWRQDFAGHLEFGDIYYDLAKLYGGILLNYDLIKLNLFRYTENAEGIAYDFAQRYLSPMYVSLLSKFIETQHYDLKRVRLLVGLIYLNMSPLHHYPFDKMLYAHARYLLHQELSQGETPGIRVP